ncbi:MAG: hypothetical protein KGM15_03490 [Pseudomonadota bacterium]|nr:hypothetical protein [Pseudomonadota bacterium]
MSEIVGLLREIVEEIQGLRGDVASMKENVDFTRANTFIMVEAILRLEKNLPEIIGGDLNYSLKDLHEELMVIKFNTKYALDSLMSIDLELGSK